MSKEVLAVDVDEVLYPFIDEFMLFHNRVHGTNVSLSEMRSYYLEELFDLSTEEVTERVYAYHGEDDTHVQAIEGAENAIEVLSKRFDLVIVTARHPQFSAQTTRWISDRFGNAFIDVNCIGHELSMDKPPSKAEVCSSIGAVALIDDSVSNLQRCAEKGIGAVLFGDYPWTKVEVLPEGIIHKRDWPAVLEHFDVSD